jgi:succinyl-CoA synthetase beta subunit
MAAMERLYRERDCSLVEINPLIITREGVLMALDAKILLDDNALFRQSAVSSLRDSGSEDPAEMEAKEAGLSYIGLTGDIGCVVNGAGLAMATMDTIQYYGGSPANFLDVGGSSNPRKIAKAFELILRNPRVKVILMNIFGGITRCDDVARGILAAKEESGFTLPVIVRLVGTNEKEGRALLAGQALASAATLEEGARLAVKMRGEK